MKETLVLLFSQCSKTLASFPICNALHICFTTEKTLTIVCTPVIRPTSASERFDYTQNKRMHKFCSAMCVLVNMKIISTYGFFMKED